MHVRNVETGARAVVRDDFKLPDGWVEEKPERKTKAKTAPRGRKAASAK